RPLTDFGGKTSIFSHPVYLFLREFSLQDFRGGSKVATNNLKLGTFGAFDNEWHTLAFRFAGNNSLQVTPVIDGQDGTPFTLTQSPVSAFAADKLHVTDITRGATYPVLIDSIAVEVNSTDTAA
ncbi:hypothetical protein NEP58_26335, partial [Escherichia coli]|nr:hypothetical protein [Escherichia coli]